MNAIQRDSERMARMLGADLERNVSMNLIPTAVQFAAFLGWDTDGETIDAVAEELADGDTPEPARRPSRSASIDPCSRA